MKKNTQIGLEEKKVKELARDFTKNGYNVLVEPSTAELPNFMKSLNYLPDLIVYGERENTVIEVSSSSSNVSMQHFAKVADVINEQKGWVFELVMTNPKERKHTEGDDQLINYNDVQEKLKKAKQLLKLGNEKEYNEAALLLAWIATESAIRYALMKEYDKKNVESVLTLIRDAVTYGVVSRADGSVLETLMKTRNAVIHGFLSTKISAKHVRKLIDICSRVLTDFKG